MSTYYTINLMEKAFVRIKQKANGCAAAFMQKGANKA